MLPEISSLLLLLLPIVSAQEDHSNHGGGGGGDDTTVQLAHGNMIMYFHTTPGDTILFEGWVPTSRGAVAGACIGLILLGIAERWLAACRAGMEMHWRSRALIAQANALRTYSSDKSTAASTSSSSTPSLKGGKFMRRVPPFIPAHDLVRGLIFLAQSALGYALMLIVMTYNVGFFLSIVVGLGLGEVLFGRYIVAAGGGQDHVH